MRIFWLPFLAFRFLFRILPLVLVGAVVWLWATRVGSPAAAASRFCAHCGGRSPDVGSYCPLCGRKTV